MSIWFDVTRIVTLLNITLLLGLLYVWVRNHLSLRTRLTFGFLVFGTFLLVENSYAFYIFVIDPTTSGWFAEIPARYNFALMVLAILQAGALGTLSWVTRA
ncbi:hypothetical protein NKF26_23560 [Haladaptatus sp. AB618]|uniref:hypothetical protein n=1 Tax=Haladaptatus sp. AB618 TaxID=2934173 RepID=UPI00209BCE7B|nr:hypothetical protein [Haladaptatus sp. AB618]MCO8256799.1 hypothetical protein [Haladaptatus sp. AB618]